MKRVRVIDSDSAYYGGVGRQLTEEEVRERVVPRMRDRWDIFLDFTETDPKSLVTGFALEDVESVK